MMIPITREPENLGEPFEDCCFCDSPTEYWDSFKDVPVCPECALNYECGDVPTKVEWLERWTLKMNKRRLRLH